MRLHSQGDFSIPDRSSQESSDPDGLRTNLCKPEENLSDRELLPEAFASGLPTMHVLGGHGFLWPLFVAGSCLTTTPEILDHVRNINRRLVKL